jgi:hypothetical protein
VLELTPGTVLALAESVIIKHLSEADKYYAFNVENGEHYELNRSAHWMLMTIESGICYSEVQRQFAKEFDLTDGEANEDLNEALCLALENGIIREVCREKEPEG